MIKKLIFSALALIAVIVFVQSIPDIARYVKIREM